MQKNNERQESTGSSSASTIKPKPRTFSKQCGWLCDLHLIVFTFPPPTNTPQWESRPEVRRFVQSASSLDRQHTATTLNSSHGLCDIFRVICFSVDFNRYREQMLPTILWRITIGWWQDIKVLYDCFFPAWIKEIKYSPNVLVFVWGTLSKTC